ncbi:MAG TPA: hypothetical protein VKU02_26945 [Gemmataceae bacterium]|nr:hypothetical protein [Gemmataceae bacterium]
MRPLIRSKARRWCQFPETDALIRTRSFGLLIVLIAGVGAASGCSTAGTGKVTGSVKLDGKPLADAEVRFCPTDDRDRIGNSTRTHSDGSFELELHPQFGKTLLPGHYVALVSKLVQKNGAVPPAEDAGMLLAAGSLHNSLPPMYDEFDKSPFKVEIGKGDNALAPFELKSR